MSTAKSNQSEKQRSHEAKFALVKHVCAYGLYYFCDGTPNYSQVPLTTTAINPCKYFRNHCPVKNAEVQNNAKKR